MAGKKNTEFVNQLKRSNTKIRADRAQRIGAAVGRAHNILVDKIQGEIDAKNDQLEAMMDLSASNQNTSLNVVSPAFNAGHFVETLNLLQVEIEILERKQSVAQSTTEKWFSGE